MTVGYHQRCDGSLVPDYCCQGEGIATATPSCQSICGSGVDAAVAALVLDELNPLAIEAALQVSAELAHRAAEADRIRATGVERARYAAEAARRRYLAVDPANRLVAEALEADWNHKLRELADAQDDYERARQAGAAPLSDAQQARIRALAADLPGLWADPATPMRERKRLIRLLVTDVTLLRGDEYITAQVRLPGGTEHTLSVPRPLRAWEAHTTPDATIALIDELLADHTYDEAVKILNERRPHHGWGKAFTVPSLTFLCRARNIPDLRQRLRAAGMLTLDEIAAEFGVCHPDVKIWQRRGAITADASTDVASISTTPVRHVPPTAAVLAGSRPQKPLQPSAMMQLTTPQRASEAQPQQEAQYEAHSFDSPSSTAARMRSRSAWTVFCSETKAGIRHLQAQASHQSRWAGASAGSASL